MEGTENTIWPQAAAFFDNLQWPGGFFTPRLAEHVWVLAQGQLIAQGTPSVVTADEKVVEAYLGHGTAARLRAAALAATSGASS